MIPKEEEIISTWIIKDITLSICCISYNHAKYIEQAIKGFLKQKTNFAIEILIYDDASTDGTKEIIKKFQSKYPNIIKPIFQNENQFNKGKLVNFEFNVERALGKYYAICEGDDYWIDSFKLQKQVDFLKNNPKFVGCGHNTKIEREDILTSETIINGTLKDIYTVDDFTRGDAYLHASSMVYRIDKNMLNIIKLLKKGKGDWFLLILSSRFGLIKYINEIMSVYRIHGKGVWSKQNKDEQIINSVKLILKVNKLLNFEFEENLFTLLNKNLKALSFDFDYKSLFKILSKNDLINITNYNTSLKKEFTFITNIKKLKTPFIDIKKYTNRKSTLSKPKIYSLNGEFSFLDNHELKCPDVDIKFFQYITLIAGTDSLINNNKLYHQELKNIKPEHTIKRKHVFRNFNILNKIKISTVQRGFIELPYYNHIFISLMKEHSTNYYHWITENIPKITLILKLLKINSNLKELFKNKTIIFLIDEKTPIQCLEMLEILCRNEFKYSIKKYKTGTIIRCVNFLYCSSLWNSFDNIDNKPNLEDFFPYKHDIKVFLESLNSKISLTTEKATKYIYLQRKSSQIRTILNINEVENYFIKNNFLLVNTEDLSFIEQFNLFKSAKLIVGATGAAFSNILFMQENTNAIIFYPDHPSTIYTIFQPLADISKINLIHFHVKPSLSKNKLSQTVHTDYYVDIKRLNLLLQEFL